MLPPGCPRFPRQTGPLSPGAAMSWNPEQLEDHSSHYEGIILQKARAGWGSAIPSEPAALQQPRQAAQGATEAGHTQSLD